MAIFKKLKQVIGKVRKPKSQNAREKAATPISAQPAGPLQNTMNELQSVPQVTPQEVWNQLEAGQEVAFLDIRMPWDYQAMHPKGAKPLPINEITASIETLDKEASYVLSCYHGYSSQDAAAFLLENGFTDVKSMMGGFSGWAAAGLPVEGKYRE